MKPDWKDAPEWAQWLAQHANGSWHWFENRPRMIRNGTSGWYDLFGKNAAVSDVIAWENTLAKRPDSVKGDRGND